MGIRQAQPLQSATPWRMRSACVSTTCRSRVSGSWRLCSAIHPTVPDDIGLRTQTLGALVSERRYREDLFTRRNLWTFHLPGLVDRREDIEPNLVYKLRHYAEIEGREITSNKKALECGRKGLERKLVTNLTANVVGCSRGFDLNRKGDELWDS